VIEENGKIFLSANKAFLTITPFSSDYYWLKKPSNVAIKSKSIQSLLEMYDILVVPGEFSGYAMEVNEAESFRDFEDYMIAAARQQLDINPNSRSAIFESLTGISLNLKYMGNQLKAAGIINGTHLNFEQWADRGVYKSPVLTVKDNAMEINNKKLGYRMTFKNKVINYQEIEIK
jgi:uracil DNA glycosylase